MCYIFCCFLCFPTSGWVSNIYIAVCIWLGASNALSINSCTWAFFKLIFFSSIKKKNTKLPPTATLSNSMVHFLMDPWVKALGISIPVFYHRSKGTRMLSLNSGQMAFLRGGTSWHSLQQCPSLNMFSATLLSPSWSWLFLEALSRCSWSQEALNSVWESQGKGQLWSCLWEVWETVITSSERS